MPAQTQPPNHIHAGSRVAAHKSGPVCIRILTIAASILLQCLHCRHQAKLSIDQASKRGSDAVQAAAFHARKLRIQLYFCRAWLSSAHMVPCANSILPCTKCCLFRGYFVDTAAYGAVGNRTAQLAVTSEGRCLPAFISIPLCVRVCATLTYRPPGPLCSESD